MNCPNCGEFIACEDETCFCTYCEYGWDNSEVYEPDLDDQGSHNKPTKDDLDLVAAALGLKSSVWARATLHITPRRFNAEMNGKPLNNKKRK